MKQLNLLDDTQAQEEMFATPIKEMHNFCIEYLKQRGIDRKLAKDGKLLQLLGTEWGRNTLGPNIWVQLTEANIKLKEEFIHPSLKSVFIISDCRFKNEFYHFPKAIRVRLECDREIRKQRCENWREDENHPSEIDLDYESHNGLFDYLFYTEGDRWTPESMAKEIVDELVFRRENARFSKTI